jgi:hypothetical protein
MQATKQFTELDNYENCWPVLDYLKLRLKQTSEDARKEANLKACKVTNVFDNLNKKSGVLTTYMYRARSVETREKDLSEL